MKIFICSSKHFYDRILSIKKFLESKGHNITLPNSFEYPLKEEEMKLAGKEEHAKWKGEMIKLQEKKILSSDAILVLNFDKKGMSNYIGGATFLEMFKAWEHNKKLFLYNPIPEGILMDEIKAFNPRVINGDLSLVN